MAYIKQNDLQNPTDRRNIYPDDNIKKLFHLSEGDELHFSNFQTYMKRLYDRTFPAEEQSLSSDTSNSDVEEEQPKKSKGKRRTGKKKSNTASQNV